MSETSFNPINLVVLLGFIGLIPFALTMITSYCKIVVVTFLIRNALGVQQVPPSMVLTGLAIALSIFVMAPVGMDTYNLLKAQPVEITSLREADQIFSAISDASGPLEHFLKANSDPKVIKAFTNAAFRIWPADLHPAIQEDNFIFLIPSFVVTELTKAFQIGFLLYLPFIAIDLIISNILLAMGMMMVSPMAISLPFKLMLFVTLDGWLKISQGLILSYQY